MADRTLFSRLQRLFSTNVIVRNVGGKKLKVADTEQVQSQVKSHLVDRYSKLHSSLDSHANSGYSTFAQLQAARLGLFKDYETMESDSIIASALDTYADESTMKSAYGESLEIQSDNDQIKQILHNLFYDIMNIEFNLWPWVRNMCKYGDFFLYLDISDKFGIHNVVPLSPYEIIRSEGEDPDNPYYTKFYLEAMEQAHPYFARSSSNKRIEFENFQIAHFRLASDSNLLPYGKSMMESGRKVWKQLTLMEDAMLIHRIMRAPEKRVFKVDIGNIPPNEVDNYMQKIINKMKKTPFMDDTTGDYNLKFNIQNLTEDFFMPVRGGDSGTGIESLPGMQYETTEDIEYLKNRMLAALRIPKAFLGYDESVGSKATLAAEDVRFARTIERIQRILTSELTKIAVVHLYSQGYTDEELVNFELKLTNPSTIYEQEKIELWSNKVNLARDVKDNSLMSSDWIYKNIFNFTEKEKESLEKEMVEDQKTKFRYSQIEQEGNDPAESGDSVGTPSDMASIGMGADDVAEPPDTAAGSIFNQGGSPEGGQEGAGRPKEVTKYGKDGSARGREPLGRPKIPMALAHFDRLKKSFGKKGREILRETIDSEEIDKEYKDFTEDK